MTVYTFQFIALDSNGEQMPNAVGSFYGSSDTAFITPIQVTAQDGTLTTTPTANRLGLVTFSYDGDDPRGYWKSGVQSIPVVANEAADTAAAAAVAAQAAAEAAAAATTAPTEETVRTVLDTDVTDPASMLRSTTDDAYPGRATRTKHAPAFGVFFPEAEGATGLGTVDDTAAWNNAITTANAAGGKATVHGNPGATYLTAGPINGKTGVDIEGQGATLKYTGSVDRPLTLSSTSGVSVSNLTLDVGTTPPSSVIFASSADRLSLKRIKITTTATSSAGFRLNNCTNTEIERCHVQGGANAYNISGGSNNKIKYCTADGNTASVLINPNGATPATDIDVIGVTVTNPGTGYQIRAAGVTGTHLSRIRFIGCTVIGPNHSFTTGNGTSDQINAVYTDVYTVIGCHSLYGGDMGFSCSNCTQIIYDGCYAAYNDTGGIVVSGGCSFATVTGCIAMNNGQNRNSDRAANGRFGIGTGGGSYVTMTANTIGDNQSTPTQNYGARLQLGGDVFTVGPNTYHGNVISNFYTDGIPTNVTNLDAGSDVFGKRAAYASVTSSSATTIAATNTWTAATGAPTITLPNDGGTYRLDLSGTDAAVNPAGSLSLALSGDGGSTWIKQATHVHANTNAVDRVHMSAGNVVGSGQTVTVWVFATVTGTATLVASGSSPLELWATRIA